MSEKLLETPTAPKSARERLLDAADALFYAEGVHVVGIDRVIERAGVAKATLYSAFGNKDGLVRAYLTRRHDIRQARIKSDLTRYSTPRDRLLGVFDIVGEIAAENGFRGCAFLNASAEDHPSPDGPGTCIKDVSDSARAWVRALLVGLCADAGVADPERLGARMVLLYDGATVSSKMDGDPSAAAKAREIAAILLDAA